VKVKKTIIALFFLAVSLFGYDGDAAAKDLACKTITADAYYAKYAKIGNDNWWTYVSNDGSLVIAHKQGTTVKDMGTSFFVINDKFNGTPTFKYEDGKIKISFPSLLNGFSNITALSNKEITADAYYAKYTKIGNDNWWTYVSNDGSLVIAHKQGTTVKDMGTSFFVINDKFNGTPTFKYEDGKIKISFPPLKGQDSCGNGSLETPPTPSVPNTNELNLPPSPPSLQ
jgi:hypothetical protein